MNQFERFRIKNWNPQYLQKNMNLEHPGCKPSDQRTDQTHAQITPTRLLHSSQDNDSDGICPSRGRRCPYLCNFVGCVATSHPCSQQRLEEGPEALQFKCVLLAVSIWDYLTDVSFWTAFLGADSGAANGISNPSRSAGVGNTDRRKYSLSLFQILLCPNLALGYLSEDTAQRKGTGGFWTVEYYQPYFDVDTATVRFQLLLDLFIVT